MDLKKFFAIQEIEASRTLQRLFWVFWLLIVLDIVQVSQSAKGVLEFYRGTWDFECWPHLQSCERLFFLSAPPLGYSYSFLMLTLFGCLMASAYFALKQNWGRAHFFFAMLVIWKFTSHFILQQTHLANFQYYCLPLMILWLIAPRKESFLRLMFVTLYAFASTVKFNSSWIEGSYFSTLSLGLPLAPCVLIPVVTNLVILFEILGSFALLSRNSKIQRAAFWGWVAFHLYSVLLVGFFYPLHCLPTLFLLFGHGPVSFDLPPLRRAVAAFSFWAFMVLLHLMPHFAPRDLRWTGEAYQYGLGMIEGNYQCRVQWEVFDAGGKSLQKRIWTSLDATHRCPPYITWFHLKKRCEKDPTAHRIRYTHDTSLDGSPFYRIVDSENACALEYPLFVKKDWIQTPGEGAKLVGYPRPNGMRDSRQLRRGHQNVVFATPTDSPMKLDLGEALPWLMKVYWLIWLAACIFAIHRYFRNQRLDQSPSVSASRQSRAPS